MLEKIRRSCGRRWVGAGGHYSQRPGVSDRVTTTQTARALRKSRMRAKRFFFAAMDLGVAFPQTGHIFTENRRPNRTEISVFSVFGFGFGFEFSELWCSASVSVFGCHRTETPSNQATFSSKQHRLNKSSEPAASTRSSKRQPSPIKADHTPSLQVTRV